MQTISNPPTRQKNTRLALIISFGVLLLATAGMLLLIFMRLTDTFIGDAPSFIEVAPGGISTLNPPRPLDDFTLTAHTGDPLSLSDLRGKTVVMSFGYTYCPDVCPLTLMEYRRVNEMLGEDAEHVQFMFISVDGERDTAERLNLYMGTRNVDEFAVALTGTEGELRRMGVDYGLYFEKQFNTGSQAFYLVDHTASTYIIDPQGRLTNIIGFGTDTQTVYETILAQVENLG
ncbi:MAG: SCO family protein [Chloroflexota bacterium]